MIFTHDSDHFTIAPATWAPDVAARTSGEDILFDVAVRCLGFEGRDQVWITSQDWSRFVGDFGAFEKSRTGSVTLEGAISQDFSLRFLAYDRAGHISLSGHMVRPSPIEGRQVRLEFHLEIEPSCLTTALGEFESIAHAA